MTIIKVDVDLDEIEDNDLIFELIHRGYCVTKIKSNRNSLEEVMEFFRTKNPKVCLADSIELENHIRRILTHV